MTKRLRDRGERGAVAVLVALLSLVILAFMAFVSDVGFAYSNQRRIQNGSDAAALAVGRRIAAGAAGTANCATIATAYSTTAQRTYAAGIFAKTANPGAGLAPGSAGFAVTCDSVGSNDQTVTVKVQGQQNSPTFIGGIFGEDHIALTEASKVIVAPLGSAVGLRPFAICRTLAEQVQNSPGTTFTIPITNDSTGCGFAPGNWAMLDFNGGNNNTGDMKTWIADGFNGTISNAPPVKIEGDPGFNVNAATTEMDIMMAADDIVLPVYSSVTGTGSNAEYTITGFVSVTPCRYRINNKSGPTSSPVNPGCAPLSNPPAEYLQVKYSAFIPIGSVSLTCKMGDDTCDNGPRTTTLAD